MIKQTIKNSLLLCLSTLAFLQVQAQTDHKVMNATNEKGKTLGVDIYNYDKTKITFSGKEMTVAVDGKQKTMDNFLEGSFTFSDAPATSTAKVSSVGLATFCSPMEVKRPEEIDVFKVTELKNGRVKVEELTQATFPMGEGLLLRGVAGSYVFTQTLFPNDEAEIVSGNILVGTVKETKFAAKSVLTLGRNNKTDVVGFWHYTGTSMNAGYAYIDGSNTPQTLEGAPIIWEETTDIKSVISERKNEQQYNLAGQRVGRGYKGIVISANGKKYIKGE